MSRGLLALLTVAAVGSNLVALFMGGPGAADAAHGMLDRHLERSAGSFSAAVESASWREAAILADAVRVPSAAASLARGTADQSALDALSAAYAARAEKVGGLSAPGLIAVVTERGSAESRLGEAARISTEASALPGAAEALAGAPQVTLAKLDGKLFRLALVPAGPGTVAAIGFTLDDAFAKSIGARLSADVTFLDTSSGAQVLGSTLAGSDRTAVSAAGSSGAGKPFAIGPAPAELSFLGVGLPLFADKVAAIRGRSLEVPGVDGAKVVFSTETVATLAPLARSQKATLVTTIVLLVLGLALVAFGGGKGGSASGVDDADIATLATQLERLAAGENGVRATEAFPGPLGRIARSANQLASRPAAAAAPSGISHFEPPPPPPDDPGAGMFDSPPARPVAPPPAPPPPAPPPPAPAPAARDDWEDMPTTAAPSPMAAAAAMANSPAWDHPTANLRQPAPVGPPPAAHAAGEADFGGMFEAPPPPPPASDPFAAAMQRQQAVEPEPPPDSGEGEFNPEATVVAAVPAALLRATSRQEPAKPAGDPDEPHFKQVFQEFQTTREKCGEPADGLTFDKFLVKLKKNREQLVEKYKCKTVRFTVYVKDGKAALKATPVRD